MFIRMIERSLVYPRPPRERGDWRPRVLRPQNVWFRSKDNTKLHGWYVPHPEPKRLVVYCHGNAQHVADHTGLLMRLQQYLDATVFVYDYRGYGRSRGNPVERGCIADGMAAQRWLAEREGVSCEDITVVGRSLGGGIAVAMAAEQGARALVIEATFTKMTDVAAHRFPWLPVRLVMRNRYNSIKRIQKYDGPVFQSHGTTDEIVPMKMAKRLFEASPSRMKQFYEVNFARHNDSPPPAYYAALSAFLDRVDEQSGVKLPVRRHRRQRQLVS
ncbi:MAG TPA: alpha/beta hydrolase [Lacipirellulaceae bacterium]|nr:alpha/beta hydrolase [Lacipirellulaceae bacterium]